MAGKPLPERLGRYKIVRELGKGAMGIVYEGVDPNIGRRVAIKTARRDVMEATGRADEMMERFLREAKAAGGLSHPNIITIYDAGEEDSMAYIAMEYLEGGDLFDYMEQKKRFTPEEAVEIAATVCEALAVAHDSGIVHRDVKPANILMPTNAALKVADFGIARVSNSNLTQEGAMIGTPHYMSPEQFMGQRADARSDLFSVGIICYEMLTGEKPFAGEALSTVMHNTIKSAPIDPTELNFAINDILSRVVLKSLAKKPQERYADGRAMASAMREALKPHPDPSITLVGGDGGDATVLSQPADIDSTVASVQLPDGTAGPKRPAPKAAP
ncbi:MAG: Protein kinase, partial [Candidatus Hydrogenedentes bacterium]|nr:Protein kinase [Candidatus Hydrogenedentota bacterium]